MFRAYISAYRRYFDFKGRSSRKEYWGFFVGNVLIVALLIYFAPFLAEMGIPLEDASLVYSAVSFVPGISLAVRRVHDRNLSWYYSLIPFYNFILMCLPGDEGGNQYGPNPNAVTGSGGETSSNEQRYCENCGAKLPPAGKKDGKGTAIAGVIAFLSVIVNVQLYNHVASQKAELADLQDYVAVLENDNSELREDAVEMVDDALEKEAEIEEYEEELFQSKEEIDFYENNVVLFPRYNEEKLYHKYWCEGFQDNIWWGYFAKDVETMEELGTLSPCPKCYDSDYTAQ